MIDSIAVSRALADLGGASSFSCDVSDELTEDWYASVVWSGVGSKPTLAALKTKMDELQTDFDSKKYQRDRQGQYPNIGDQLDMLWHAVDGDDALKTTYADFHTAIKAVKDANPKG